MNRWLVMLAVVLLLAPAPARAQSSRALALRQRIQQQLAAQHGRMRVAVAVLHLPSGERVGIDQAVPCPLASVFKLPIMIELARQMQHSESIRLDQSLLLHESDKCIGSGSLRTRPDGSQVTVQQAVELMETISDNTATDLIFNLIGTDSVNRLMQSLGLRHSDIYLTNRPAYLISLGLGKGFRGLGARQIAARWLAMSRQQRVQSVRDVLAENHNLPLSTFQQVEDASAARQTGSAYRDDVLLAAALDNVASASDIADLLGMLDQGKILDARWTQYCMGVLGRQKYNTRIPRYLPRGTRTYHKTGTITGIVNDAGIIQISPRNHLVVVAFARDVAEGQATAASALIGRIARAAYDAYR